MVKATVFRAVTCLLERGYIAGAVLKYVRHTLVQMLIVLVDLSLTVNDQLLLATVKIVDALHG